MCNARGIHLFFFNFRVIKDFMVQGGDFVNVSNFIRFSALQKVHFRITYSCAGPESFVRGGPILDNDLERKEM